MEDMKQIEIDRKPSCAPRFSMPFYVNGFRSGPAEMNGSLLF